MRKNHAAGVSMTQGLKGRLILALAVSLLSAAAAAAEAPKATVTPGKKLGAGEIRECMRKNFAHRGALRDLSVETTDREGKKHPLKMRLFWKPSKAGQMRMNLRVLEPADLKGSSYLLLEKPKGEDVYFHLPALKLTQKISGENSSQPLWGTEFSYAEIKQVQGMLIGGATTRKADAKVGERAVFVLETQTKADETGYEQVQSSVDQLTCTLLKSEFIAGGKAVKRLDADVATLLTVDEYSVVLSYTMHNLKSGTRTTLNMSDLSLLEGTREPLFDPKTFYQHEE